MSCFACSKRYGFFTKEVGCPNCGYSFCTKCLKKTIEVPRLNNAKHNVCLSCFDKISKQKQQPNETRLNVKNMSALDAPINEELLLPMTIIKPITNNNNQQQNDQISETTDDVIKQRLLSLKEDRLNQPGPSGSGGSGTTDTDIAIRIANLKGVDYQSSKNDPNILLNMDTRSDQAKVQDLVKQFMEENDLDKAADPISDIERRLALLREDRGGDGSNTIKPNQNPSSSVATTSINSTSTSQQINIPSDDDDDDEEANDEEHVQRLVRKYLAESKLPDDETINLTPEEREYIQNVDTNKQKNEEELPWCTICNEDAELRYQGDLFCKDCYKEIKDDE